jgi:tetratricopeptide (TPR) repeat protein
MEVAVGIASLTSWSKNIVRVAVLSALAGTAAVSAVGCGNLTGGSLLTYAGEARDEGIRHYNAGQYAEAAGSFQNAIRQRPQDWESYYYLGRTYEAMKNYHQALSQYATARSVLPQTAAGRADTAAKYRILEGLGQAIGLGNDQALEQAAFARTGGPATAEDHLVLAKARRIQGDADAALTEYRAAAQGDPASFEIAKEFGLYLLQLHQKQEAGEELKRAYAIAYRATRKEDEQVNAGLLSLGVIPGPSLAEMRDLRQPLIPQGPIPNIDVRIGEGGQAATPQQ